VQTRTRHERVLIEANEDVARKLRAEPGVWFLVGAGELDRARVMSQTANRIKRGELEDFRKTPAGQFDATSTADKSRKDKVADVELFARFIPTV